MLIAPNPNYKKTNQYMENKESSMESIKSPIMLGGGGYD